MNSFTDRFRLTCRFPVHMRKVVAIVGVACGFAACADGNGTERDAGVPQFLTGEFVDDYGIEYSISAQEWLQHPATRYRIVAWLPGERILVQSDSGSSGGPGLWTRIDWVRLEDAGTGYVWAYCYAAYDARSREEVVAAPPAQQDSPRIGCNGYPFSRMKRTAPPER